MAQNLLLPIIEQHELEFDDDFYEKIQAPKFVDLTAPDNRLPNDDQHWFCSRFGCDQKHEQELDSEAIYNNFVLRVMAARSPNLRLKKALNRREREASSNLKCPLTAPAKPRISRMAFISSLSQKVTQNNVKVVKPLLNVTASATPNDKVKQSPSMTKALTTPRNQNKVSNLEQFRSVQNKKSPKKVVGTNSSEEMKTSMKALCSAMKRLEFNGVKKYGEECNNSLPVASSRKKQFKRREVKSRVFDSLYSSNRKEPEANTVRCLKEKKVKAVMKHRVPVQHESDSSVMEIEEKLRSDSLERSESSVRILSEASRDAITSLSSSKEEEKKKIRISVKGKVPDAKKRKAVVNSMNYDNKENEIELDENDGKENSSAPSENIEMSTNNNGSKKVILGNKQEDRKTHKKSTTTTPSSQVVKYRKLKPTNPKPFKFRTDERGILKEANLEKKIVTPLKEITAKDGKEIRKHNKNESCLAQSVQKNYSNCNEKSRQTIQQNQTGNIHGDNSNSNNKVQLKFYPKTPNRNPDPKLRKHIDQDENFKRKSKMMQRNVAGPLSVLSMKKEKVVHATASKLGVIVEKPTDMVKPTETAKPRINDASCSQGRKALTVPKEPKFQSLRVPKSCTTRKLT